MTTETSACIGHNEAVYDPGLPGSKLLQEPKQLAAVLSSLLANSMWSDLSVRIRRHLPGKRCIAAVDCSNAPGLMIKLYPAGKGAEVFETLQKLRSHGFDAGRFRVCRPLAYDPVWRILILERARGESLRSRLLINQDASATEGAAQWLLSLHSCGLTDGRRYDFSRHLYTLGLQGQHLAEIFPEAGRRYRDLLPIIEKRGRLLSGWAPAPTHRDFTPEHLFLNGDQLTGLDFDEFCQYDPLFDVGHFGAHLRLIALSHADRADGLEGVADRFRAAYRLGARDYSAPRVRSYQAMAYLKLAYVVGVVERPRNWEYLVTALLDDAQHFI